MKNPNRIKGRHSFRVNATAEQQQLQLRAAVQKRARKGAVRIEASERGQIACLLPTPEEQMVVLYADEELRGSGE